MFYDYAYQMPEITRSSENGTIEKVSVSFNLPKGYEWREELPSLNSYIEPYGYFTGYQLSEIPGYDVIRLNFSTQSTAELPGRENRKAGDDIWTYHLFNYERDLRLHPKYKTYFNYSLAVSADATDAEVSSLKSTGVIWGFNAKTATDLTIPKDLIKKLRWVQETNELPENWTVGLKRLYTFDNYKRFTATATRTVYHKDFNGCNDYLLALNCPPCSMAKPTIAIPFCTMEPQFWMIEDSMVSGDGDLWTVVTSLSYNPDGWTVAIYTA